MPPVMPVNRSAMPVPVVASPRREKAKGPRSFAPMMGRKASRAKAWPWTFSVLVAIVGAVPAAAPGGGETVVAILIIRVAAVNAIEAGLMVVAVDPIDCTP